MRKIAVISFLFILTFSLQAQEQEHRGTIKVNNSSQPVKVVFDNVYYRLVGIDRFGNTLDSSVVEFQMSVTIKGIFYSEKTTGPFLSNRMQELLGQCDGTSTLFFDKIKVKDKQGNLFNMPKFQYRFAYMNEDND